MLVESHFLILLHECNVFSKLYMGVELEVKASTFRQKSEYSQGHVWPIFFLSVCTIYPHESKEHIFILLKETLWNLKICDYWFMPWYWNIDKCAGCLQRPQLKWLIFHQELNIELISKCVLETDHFILSRKMFVLLRRYCVCALKATWDVKNCSTDCWTVPLNAPEDTILIVCQLTIIYFIVLWMIEQKEEYVQCSWNPNKSANCSCEDQSESSSLAILFQLLPEMLSCGNRGKWETTYPARRRSCWKVWEGEP